MKGARHSLQDLQERGNQLLGDVRELCEEAEVVHEQSKSKARRLKVAQAKLDLVGEELQGQTQNVSQLSSELTKRLEDLQRAADALSVRCNHAQRSMHAMLSHLKQRPLHQAMQGSMFSASSSMGSHSAAPSTLFDFVDDASVDSLVRAATASLAALATALAKCKREVDGLLLHLSQLLDQCASIPLHAVPRTLQDTLSRQVRRQQLMGGFAKRCEALTNHIARALNPESDSPSPIQSAEELHELYLTLVEEKEGIWGSDVRAMVALDNQLDAGIKQCSEAHAKAQGLFVRVDSLSSDIQPRLARFRAEEEEFNLFKSRCIVAIEEIENLVEWYRCFDSAYDALVDEVQGQQQYVAQLAARRREMQAALDELFNAELARRTRFDPAAARYLPESLTNLIRAPPPRLNVALVDSPAYGVRHSHPHPHHHHHHHHHHHAGSKHLVHGAVVAQGVQFLQQPQHPQQQQQQQQQARHGPDSPAPLDFLLVDAGLHESDGDAVGAAAGAGSRVRPQHINNSASASSNSNSNGNRRGDGDGQPPERMDRVDSIGSDSGGSAVSPLVASGSPPLPMHALSLRGEGDEHHPE